VSALALGWLGQALYVLRFAVQWHASERAQRSVVPDAFWWLSLGGAGLLAAYTANVGELLLCSGYVASAWVYARQLWPRMGARSGLEPLLVCGFLGLAWIAGARSQDSSAGWLAVLLAGQLIWNGRFAWQWWLRENEGERSFSDSFWWWSLAANLLLLAYAVHRRDALLISAFAFGPVVQVRNLTLSLRARKR
jgi:lipid-A-disaccharide synthase-like uncharacterized protein